MSNKLHKIKILFTREEYNNLCRAAADKGMELQAFINWAMGECIAELKRGHNPLACRTDAAGAVVMPTCSPVDYRSREGVQTLRQMVNVKRQIDSELIRYAEWHLMGQR